MPERLGFECVLGKPGGHSSHKASGQQRLLVMGDLRGRSACSEPSLGLHGRSLVKVDIDNLDQMIHAYLPSISLPTGNSSTEVLEIRRLEDFHPDHLYQTLPVFQKLKHLRQRLQHPASFAEAAAELALPQAEPVKESTPSKTEDGSDTLQQLLGKRPARLEHSISSQLPDALSQFIRDQVTPHLAVNGLAKQAHYLAVVDQSSSQLMRSFLHHPAFQALESLWTSIHWLLTHIEDEASMPLYLLDSTKSELQEDCKAASCLQASGLYHLLQSKAPDDPPWALLVGAYTFTDQTEDRTLLQALGALGSSINGPFLAAADPQLVGCAPLPQTQDPTDWKAPTPLWDGFRHSPAAHWIGLVWPRILLRLPYGERTDPIEGFNLEEQSPERSHQAYLWGNPAFQYAALICQTLGTSDWNEEASLDIDDLPAYTYKEKGESAMQACAEVFFGERAMQAILRRGIMPVISYRNRNAVRVIGLQSIADPPTRLI